MHTNELKKLHESTIREEGRKVQDYAQQCIAEVDAELKKPSPDMFRSGQIELTLSAFPEEKLRFLKWRDGIQRCKDHYEGKGWQVQGGFKGSPPKITLIANFSS